MIMSPDDVLMRFNVTLRLLKDLKEDLGLCTLYSYQINRLIIIMHDGLELIYGDSCTLVRLNISSVSEILH